MFYFRDITASPAPAALTAGLEDLEDVGNPRVAPDHTSTEHINTGIHDQDQSQGLEEEDPPTDVTGTAIPAKKKKISTAGN